MKKNTTFALVNSKGGVGKTTIATSVLPLLFWSDNMKIYIHEIDNNNELKIKNTKINFQSIEVDKSEEIISNVYFDLISENAVVNIIDIGGGDDTLHVLNYLYKTDLKGILYIVPLNDDIEQFQNALQTIEMIKKIDSKANIYLVLNKCNNINSDDSIKEQFIAIFGSEKYGIESNLHLIEGVEILFVPNTPIFGILKNIYSTTLADFLVEADDLIKNIEKYRLKWPELGREKFNENMKRYAFAKDVVSLRSQLKNFNVIKGCNE